MKNLRKMIAIAMLAMAWQSCSCDPIVPVPDGGTGGGLAGGAGGGTAGGQGGGTGGAGGQGGMGGMGGMGGAGGAGGAGGGAGGGSGATQLTEYVRNLIVTGTSDTAQPRAAAEFEGLPDDNPITFSPAFFDGGSN